MRGLSVRITIDLPDDLHKQALAIARENDRTLSETVADLIRRAKSWRHRRDIHRPQDGIACRERRDSRDLRRRALVGVED